MFYINGEGAATSHADACMHLPLCMQNASKQHATWKVAACMVVIY
jgi:hypothetical protein